MPPASAAAMMAGCQTANKIPLIAVLFRAVLLRGASRAASAASCARGALPPVLFLAVCFARTMPVQVAIWFQGRDISQNLAWQAQHSAAGVCWVGCAGTFNSATPRLRYSLSAVCTQAEGRQVQTVAAVGQPAAPLALPLAPPLSLPLAVHTVLATGGRAHPWHCMCQLGTLINLMFPAKVL